MSNKQLMLAAINDGLTDDATASAALDAIVEESGCPLLHAILEVARVWHAGVDAREIAQAVKLLDKTSDIRHALVAALAAECSSVPDGARIDVNVVAGSQWPEGHDTSLMFPDGSYLAGTITVGARWILHRAPIIRTNIANRRRRQKRRRA